MPRYAQAARDQATRIAHTLHARLRAPLPDAVLLRLARRCTAHDPDRGALVVFIVAYREAESRQGPR